jgi:hypothetical protein
MLIQQISLKRGKNVRVANIAEDKEIEEALKQLEIPHPKPVIVLVGGAAGVGWWDQFPMRKAIGIVARLAEETQSVVLDGGMQAGIMAEIGKQRKQKKFSFPLIGVAAGGLSLKNDPDFVMDPNHTHFILTPGDNWGDEASWIAKIATDIAGDKKSITVLVNGGQISKDDVDYSILENRPAFVMRGTGRMADEIPPGGKIIAVDVSQKPDDVLEFLKAKLI